jgi:hypothetical protein
VFDASFDNLGSPPTLTSPSSMSIYFFIKLRPSLARLDDSTVQYRLEAYSTRGDGLIKQ